MLINNAHYSRFGADESKYSQTNLICLLLSTPDVSCLTFIQVNVERRSVDASNSCRWSAIFHFIPLILGKFEPMRKKVVWLCPFNRVLRSFDGCKFVHLLIIQKSLKDKTAKVIIGMRCFKEVNRCRVSTAVLCPLKPSMIFCQLEVTGNSQKQAECYVQSRLNENWM